MLGIDSTSTFAGVVRMSMDYRGKQMPDALLVPVATFYTCLVPFREYNQENMRLDGEISPTLGKARCSSSGTSHNLIDKICSSQLEGEAQSYMLGL